MQLSANEKSYRAIRQKLESGQLGPGDALVTRTLAGELGVSLSPVREAIHRLATEGLVNHIPGAGAVVKQLSLEELNDLYVLRDAIESCAAGLAAETMTTDELDDLEFVIDEQAKLAATLAEAGDATASESQMTRWIKLEERFHESIIRCSRNRLLAKIIRDQRTIGRIFESHLKHHGLLTVEVARGTVQGKRELLQAFRNRDAETARSTMSQQIQNGRRHVIGILRNEGVV